MTIAIACTVEQEEKIKTLCLYLGEHVFSQCFDEDIYVLLQADALMNVSEDQLQHIETIEEASAVIHALNTIISILEAPSVLRQYEAIFQESVDVLHRFHVPFPFSFSFFKKHQRIYT